MSKALAKREDAVALRPNDAAAIARVVLHNDLSKLSDAEKVEYVHRVSESLELNWLTRPLQILKLNGREVLYATKDCTDQLRRRDKISVEITARDIGADYAMITAKATTPDGRSDSSVGAVSVGGLRGEAFANAIMKAETKAKRRVTLSISGLGFLDESETDSIPGGQRWDMNPETGELTPDPEHILRHNLAGLKQRLVRLLGSAQAEVEWKGTMMPILEKGRGRAFEERQALVHQVEMLVAQEEDAVRGESRVEREPGAEG